MNLMLKNFYPFRLRYVGSCGFQSECTQPNSFFFSRVRVDFYIMMGIIGTVGLMIRCNRQPMT